MRRQRATKGFTIPPTSQKRSWTVREDNQLKKLVAQHGTTKWSQVAEELGCRSGKQCRERWHNHLNPDVKKGGWTDEEDEIILRMQVTFASHKTHTPRYPLRSSLCEPSLA